MIIDAHLHLLLSDTFIAELFAKMDATEVDRCLLLPLPHWVFRGCVVGDNDDVAAAVRRHPDRFLGAVYLDPRDADWAETLARGIGRGAPCVKLHPTVGYFPDEARFLPMFEAIAEAGLPVLSHVGLTNFPQCHSKYAQPVYLDGLINRFPELPFILPHWGGLGTFHEAWAMMKAKANVYLDTSARRWAWPGVELFRIYQAATPLDFNRILWGTDNLQWQDEDLDDLQQILEQTGKTAFREAVYGGTASRLFGLS